MYRLFEQLKCAITEWCIPPPTQITMEEFHSKYVPPSPCNILDELTNEVKFIEQSKIPRNVLIKTPTGYARVLHSHKTVKYHVYQLQTSTHTLKCADTHIVICKNGEEKFVKDLTESDFVQTDRGLEPVVGVSKLTDHLENMYDLEIDDDTHVYYTDGIVSHNSTVSAMFLLWYAMFHDDKTVLIASNKNSGAMEMIYRIRFAYEELPKWLKPGVSDDGWNKHNVAFDNKSRIISTATSEDSGRGLSISLLFLDEFAFVAPNIQEEFWTSISPTLSTGGSCIITSTPNGDANRFARMWRAAEVGTTLKDDDLKLGFKPLRVRWDEPPGRDEKFKLEQIAILGKHKWKQEYECEFLSSDSLLIDSALLQTLSAELDALDEPKIVNDFSFWSNIKEGHTYLVGVDPSTGSGSDFSVIQVFHFPTMIQVAEYKSNTMSSPELYKKLKWILRTMETVGCTCYFSIENNGVGEGLIALYMNDENPPQFSEMISDSTSTRLGMNTNGRTKNKACIGFKDMIERGRMTIRSKYLLAEMKSFTRRRDSYAAQEGSTDDAISASLIVVRILENIAAYEQDAFDTLYSFDDNDFATHDHTGQPVDDEPLPILF